MKEERVSKWFSEQEFHIRKLRNADCNIVNELNKYFEKHSKGWLRWQIYNNVKRFEFLESVCLPLSYVRPGYWETSLPAMLGKMVKDGFVDKKIMDVRIRNTMQNDLRNMDELSQSFCTLVRMIKRTEVSPGSIIYYMAKWDNQDTKVQFQKEYMENI